MTKFKVGDSVEIIALPKLLFARKEEEGAGVMSLPGTVFINVLRQYGKHGTVVKVDETKQDPYQIRYLSPESFTEDGSGSGGFCNLLLDLNDSHLK